MNETKSIYIMISQTNTKFAGLVRRFGRTEYNHAAVALDVELEQLYAFARPKHKAVLLARLVKENVYRYTLGKEQTVNVVIFRIEVTQRQYLWVKNTIEQIYNDKEYIYNLLSVLSYPFSQGFSTYKAFSCIEFAVFILKALNYELAKPLYRYKSDDLLQLLQGNEWFRGDILEYKTDNVYDQEYFSPMTFQMIWESTVTLWGLFVRTFLYRHSSSRKIGWLRYFSFCKSKIIRGGVR